MLRRPIQRLQDALEAERIPASVAGTSPGDVRVTYRPEATAQQRARGAAIVAAHDWRPRRLRSEADLASAVESHVGAAIPDLVRLTRVVARHLAREARRLERPELLRDAGVPVDGDEPVA